MAEEHLIASRESIIDLEKYTDDLMTMDLQDRIGKDWQAVYERMSREIAVSASAKNQLLEALGAKVDKVRLIERSAAGDADELRAKINALRADVDDEAAKEEALRERIVQLESAALESDGDEFDTCSSTADELAASESQPESDSDKFDSCSSTVDDST